MTLGCFRPSLLRSSVDTGDKEMLKELVPLIEESAAAMEAGNVELAQALLDDVLCAIDPNQGHKYRKWLAQRDAKRISLNQTYRGEP